MPCGHHGGAGGSALRMAWNSFNAAGIDPGTPGPSSRPRWECAAAWLLALDLVDTAGRLSVRAIGGHISWNRGWKWGATPAEERTVVNEIGVVVQRRQLRRKAPASIAITACT